MFIYTTMYLFVNRFESGLAGTQHFFARFDNRQHAGKKEVK